MFRLSRLTRVVSRFPSFNLYAQERKSGDVEETSLCDQVVCAELSFNGANYRCVRGYES